MVKVLIFNLDPKTGEIRVQSVDKVYYTDGAGNVLGEAQGITPSMVADKMKIDNVITQNMMPLGASSSDYKPFIPN